MRKELIETAEIDSYLYNKLNGEDRHVFEARMLVHAALEEKVREQRRAHQFIRLFARIEQRRHLESIYRHLLNDAAFVQELKTIFG